MILLDTQISLGPTSFKTNVNLTRQECLLLQRIQIQKIQIQLQIEHFYQVARPLTMKKDGIQTRNRKLSAKVFIHKNTREKNLQQYENVYSFFTQKLI